MITKVISKLLKYYDIERLWQSSFFREFVFYSFSSFIYQFSRFVLLIFAAKILGPKAFGFWNLISLVLIYRGITHMGIIPAANREIPFFKGKGELQKVEEIRSVSFSYSLLLTLISCVLFLTTTILIESPSFRTPSQFMVILYFCTQMYHYLQVYLKSDRLFTLMSMQQLLYAFLLPLVAVPMAMKYGLSGFIIGQSMAIIIVLIFITIKVPFKFKITLNKKEGIRLIKVGFPIMIAAFLYGLFTTVDRWIITSFLSVKELGYYSLAIIIMGSISLFPRALAEQIYPRMAETFGNTLTYLSLVKWKVRQIVMSLSIIIPIVLVMFFIAPIVVRSFLPEYIPGITAMKIVLIGVLFLPIADSFGNFLLVINKQITYMYIHLFFVLFNLILGILFIKAGLGLNGVALSSAVSYFAYSITLSFISITILLRQKEYKGGDYRVT